MALYSKYRPASFGELVGQSQVTDPLSAALDSGRINHAYLFSGPRGCGKTSSARILARSLNCVEGPTSTPCGVCNSCVALAPGGPGTLDVTELDAASNNGVDDMRELRERANYAPAESRYRVFIIDEAHMISTQGFNALLKIVEEPPAHLIFIFATTEPDKMIGTIRSRTHNYPFRLLTPGDMRKVLKNAVDGEGVHVDDSVYPLVIRAGGGSPRDSLSILDQLIAGSGPEGLTYERALPLLGVTSFTLIDDSIHALASKDNASMFTTIDNVIEEGLEPRRFTIDLLDRLRDLMVLQAVPEALNLGLVDAPTDRADALIEQSTLFKGNELANLASMVNSGLDDMRGATSPRLLLEILCARLLLASNTVSVPVVTGTAEAAPAASPGGLTGIAAARAKAREYGQKKAAPAPAPAPTRTPQPETAPSPQPAPTPVPEPVREQTPAPAPEPAPQSAPEPVPAREPVVEVREANVEKQPASSDPLETIRSRWSELRNIVEKQSVRTAIMLTEARVLGLRGGTLVLGHSTGALAARLNAADHNGVLVKVLAEETGLQLKVECIVGTNPAEAGFTAQPAAQKSTWNPNHDSKPATPSAPAQPQAPKQESAPAEPEEPESSAETSGWGQPVKIGGPAPEAQTPAPAPVVPAAPVSPATPAAGSAKPAWKERVEQAAANAAQQRQNRQGSSEPFERGVPLPPEPDLPPDPYGYPADEGFPERNQGFQQQPAPPVEEQAPTPVPESAPLSEEEQLIQEADEEPGEMDRRDAKTIAMELLAQELGAKPL